MCLLTHSQCLYGSQGSEGALGESLDLVVIQREQGEVLQVLERVATDTVDLIGIQQAVKPSGRARKRWRENGNRERERQTEMCFLCIADIMLSF